ncbi:hypothetical protein PGH26_02515 [Sporosarcina jeotgali]|uniref:DUF3139 domain-containing protein n=1 Tax=Sporosarcina jeotgali TaxID=3020056 RepID=A0ABZ0KWQ1_9BACL|nr:hypothetical protein [Sporosarcina sp. B2O-1]WOV84819.1 hypothetical protein PGH26_02515 [Sporosarcina sp. B2O-1]
MKKSTLILSIVLFASIVTVLYMAVDRYTYRSYSPNLEDQVILGEMTMMVLDNKQYQDIASKETVYSIQQGVSRFNAGDPSSMANYEVSVVTNRQSYVFTCVDRTCTDVSNGTWTYSRYLENGPVLPLDIDE